MKDPEHDIRVDYDQPNDVADKFIEAMGRLGIVIKDVTDPKSDAPSMFYKIKAKGIQ